MSFIQTHPFAYHRAGLADPTKRVVRDVGEFWKVIRFVEQFPWVAYDTETNGTAYFRHARMGGVTFAVPNPHGQGKLAWYFPFRHQTGEQQLPVDVVLQGTRAILENPRIGKIAHNLKFERHMAAADGIAILGPCRDTMIEAHLYDENALVGLKDRALRDLGDPTLRAQELILDSVLKERAREVKLGIKAYKDAYGYMQVPIDLCGYYACYDSDGTSRLADFYEGKGVISAFEQTYATEIELVEVLFQMERTGVPVDVAYLQNLKQMTTAAMHELEPQVFAGFGGYTFNVGSDEELAWALIHRLGAVLTKRTKDAQKRQWEADDGGEAYEETEGDFAVDKEVLEGLAEQFPVCGTILEWRQAHKIASTYTDSILKRLDANHVLHGDFKQNGTNTGRLSAEKPNMQNFAGDSDKRAIKFSGKKLEDGGIDPWSVKRAFKSRSPDHERVFLDYSQIELRVLAQYSRDPVMLDVYEKGEDIHSRTSMEVFGNIEKAMRRNAKIINFGLSYCLEYGTAILTGRGMVPIQDVLPTDSLWDGLEWVPHGGVIFKGWQEVVEYEGVSATEGHDVFTADGCKLEHGQALREGASLACGASGIVPVGYAGPIGSCETRAQRERALDALRRGEVLDLSGKPVAPPLERHIGEGHSLCVPAEPEVRERPASGNVGATVRRHGAALRAGYARLLGKLQGAWDQGALQVARAFHPLGVEAVAGFGFQGAGVRPEGQRRALRAEEYAPGHASGEPAQSASAALVSQARRVAPVYDILDAGPRNRFCANGKIVSNCMSAAGFARQAKIPLHEAEAHMERFFQKYPRIGPFREEFWAHVRANRGAFRNLFGRPRRLPMIFSGDKRSRTRAERQAIGSLIQGTAAELTKASLVRMHHWEKQNRSGMLLCSTIHDEISADVPKKHAREIALAMQHMMQDFPQFDAVPIVAEVEHSDTTWADKQKFKLDEG